MSVRLLHILGFSSSLVLTLCILCVSARGDDTGPATQDASSAINLIDALMKTRAAAKTSMASGSGEAQYEFRREVFGSDGQTEFAPMHLTKFVFQDADYIVTHLDPTDLKRVMHGMLQLNGRRAEYLNAPTVAPVSLHIDKVPISIPRLSVAPSEWSYRYFVSLPYVLDEEKYFAGMIKHVPSQVSVKLGQDSLLNIHLNMIAPKGSQLLKMQSDYTFDMMKSGMLVNYNMETVQNLKKVDGAIVVIDGKEEWKQSWQDDPQGVLPKSRECHVVILHDGIKSQEANSKITFSAWSREPATSSDFLISKMDVADGTPIVDTIQNKNWRYSLGLSNSAILGHVAKN